MLNYLINRCSPKWRCCHRCRALQTHSQLRHKMKKITVIVIDDSALIRKLLSEIINSQPDMLVVGAAPDPLIAREMIRSLNPDVLTLDVEMPKMDGITMSKKLKESGSDIPIIFLTNMSDLEHISEAAETATDYIVKSDVSVDSIVVRVKERLNLK